MCVYVLSVVEWTQSFPPLHRVLNNTIIKLMGLLSLSLSLPPLMLMLLLRTYTASCYVYSSSSATPRHLQSNNSTRHTSAKVSKNNNPILVYLPAVISFNTSRHWTREQMIQWSEEWSLLLHQSRYETMRCGDGKRRRRRRIGRH